jgi:hypothetical protein
MNITEFSLFVINYFPQRSLACSLRWRMLNGILQPLTSTKIILIELQIIDEFTTDFNTVVAWILITLMIRRKILSSRINMKVMVNSRLESSIFICLRKFRVTAGFSNNPEIQIFFKIHPWKSSSLWGQTDRQIDNRTYTRAWRSI